MFDINQYVYQLGLPLIEKKGEYWNFRCIVCNDSQKSEYKKRAWILNKNGKYFYYCHNCGVSMTFITFLKRYFNHIYLEYVKENFITKKKSKTIDDIKTIKKEIIFPIDNLIPLYNLPKDHECIGYVKKRKIPFKYFKILYFCENFQKEINKLFPDKFKKYPKKDERLVIPFFDKKGKIPYIQGRTIFDNYLRYVTINLLSEYSKIYGLDRVNVSNLIQIVEGPIDSLFLDNALAMGSASINFDELLNISNKSNFVFIYDLENRNKEIIKKIMKVVDKGFKICLLPQEMKKYGKDINQFIESGISKDEIKNIIKNNTFSGLGAKIKLKLWKQC